MVILDTSNLCDTVSFVVAMRSDCMVDKGHCNRNVRQRWDGPERISRIPFTASHYGHRSTVTRPGIVGGIYWYKTGEYNIITS